MNKDKHALIVTMIKSVCNQCVLKLVIVIFSIKSLLAHEFEHSATYLGNEGILVASSASKVLFDPFFHRNFGIYQLVPEDLRQAVFAAEPPYDGVDAIFISHAHDDHFSAKDVFTYLSTHDQTSLVAPAQAVQELQNLPNYQAIASLVVAVELDYGDPASVFEIGDVLVEAVRIQHAGGERRKHIENIVYRVALNQGITVMHMGDAAPDDDLFLQHKQHWQAKKTDSSFPPYWFFSSAEGNYILDSVINAEHHIGVHVPMKVPDRLKASGNAYFSEPGQVRAISLSRGNE